MATYAGSCRARTSNVGGANAGSMTLNPAGDTPDNAGQNYTFDIDAGSSLDLIWRFTGDTGDDNQVDIELYYEDTATVVRTLYSGTTVPADNTTYTIYATDNGLVGGNPAIGTFRIRARWDKSGTGLGLEDFSLDTDGGSSAVSLGSIEYQDSGYLRGNDTWVTTHGGYPAGSTYAYGAAGDEDITLTVTVAKLPTTAVGHEQFVLDNDALVANPTLSKTTTTTNTHVVTVNDQNWVTGTKSAVVASIIGNSPLSGISWTDLGTPTAAGFDVDSAVTIDSTTLGEAMYNRGESTTVDLTLSNARSEAMTRSLTLTLKDSLGAVKATPADTGANYDLDYTIDSADDAAYDLIGTQWTAEVSFVDQDAVLPTNVYTVSSKLLMGSAVGLNDLTVTTDYAIYNRGESPHIEYYLSYARGDAYASNNVTATIGAEDSQAIATTAGGKVDYTYLIGASDAATNDETGTGKPVAATHSGNSHDPVLDVFTVSSLYHVDLHHQLSGTLNKDDWPTEDANEDFAYVILGNTIYTWIHVEGVRKDNTEIDTSGDGLLLVIYDPDNVEYDSSTYDTNADGWTDRIKLNPQAPAGDWVHAVSVTYGGNTGTDSEIITSITPLTSNLQVLLTHPSLAKPASAFRFYARTEVDGIGEPPQKQPTYRIFDPQLSDTLVASGNMKNVVDDTETINGHVYYTDVTLPAAVGQYLIWAEAQLNGNPMKTDGSFRISGNSVDPTGLFAGPP